MKENNANNQMLIQDISVLINEYLEFIFFHNGLEHTFLIYHALHNLLNGDYDKYEITEINHIQKNNLHERIDFQTRLSRINEVSSRRKQKGVFYTPVDVTRYIVINSFINAIYSKNDKMYDETNGQELLKSNYPALVQLILEKIVFDPTCGAGEFLVSALKIKIHLHKESTSKIADDSYLEILKTIHGNDIDKDSIDITKIRLFIEITQHLNKYKYLEVVSILNANFSANDFVKIQPTKVSRSDIIVGNPPYVEYGKLDYKPDNEFGNIYADVVKNSLMSLNMDGVFGLVVPLSYIATARMQKIRDYVEENTCKQFILNFADRPDCLFSGVHQKLCIVFGVKSKSNHQIYTSNYRHWYKSERKTLLNGCSVIENEFHHDGFILKLGNELDKSIFRKIFTNTDMNILSVSSKENKHALYINMRATFYVKAFSHNPGSKEYKEFKFDTAYRSFVLCLLNSSLYFLFWTMISDCWHITQKELKYMLIPNVEINKERYTELAKQLEKKLEKTKKYIGTTQTDYEYKHKECFDIINKIDDELADIYELTSEEVHYIKNFALKYRMGNDVC